MSPAIAVRERPILMSGPMVRAILDGRKTQTRRVIVAPRWAGDTVDIDCLFDLASGIRPEPDPWPWANSLDGKGYWKMECPFGQPGDSLWVRESLVTGINNLSYHAKGPGDRRQIIPRSSVADAIVDGKIIGTIIPSIHMPRWASRLTLEITEVRVERLNDLSEADAKAEGVEPTTIGTTQHGLRHRPAYQILWDSLNAKRGFGWDVNPWVWVIAFQRATSEAAT